jgi:hypothetical protein
LRFCFRFRYSFGHVHVPFLCLCLALVHILVISVSVCVLIFVCKRSGGGWCMSVRMHAAWCCYCASELACVGLCYDLGSLALASVFFFRKTQTQTQTATETPNRQKPPDSRQLHVQWKCPV